MKKKLLFVCLGNICRSPAAECIMREKLIRYELNELFECDSAGTIGHHKGSSPDIRMVLAAKKKGIEVTGSSRKLTSADLEIFDYIFAMDDENYSEILCLDEDGSFQDKVYKITQLLNDPKMKSVPDPYYGGPDGFNLVLDILDKSTEAIILKLLKEKY